MIDLRRTLAAVPIARDVIRVAGPDALTYLQGQLSQDVVDDLDVGATGWSFVLQPTGKVDAWVRLTRVADDEVAIDVDGGFGEAVVTRLRRFLLRTKADVELLDWASLALRGPGASDAARSAGDEPPAAALCLAAGWPGVEGADLLGPSVRAPEGVPLADADDYHALRIRCGVPAMGAELTERTIPAEAGQWVLDGSVSFTKGCFTGQELVARIDSRGGHVARHLRGVVSSGGEPLPPETPLLIDGSEVGRVTSSARAPEGPGIALAYVGRGVTPPAAAEARTADGVVPVTVLDLPLPDDALG